MRRSPYISILFVGVVVVAVVVKTNLSCCCCCCFFEFIDRARLIDRCIIIIKYNNTNINTNKDVYIYIFFNNVFYPPSIFVVVNSYLIREIDMLLKKNETWKKNFFRIFSYHLKNFATIWEAIIFYWNVDKIENLLLGCLH